MVVEVCSLKPPYNRSIARKAQLQAQERGSGKVGIAADNVVLLNVL